MINCNVLEWPAISTWKLAGFFNGQVLQFLSFRKFTTINKKVKNTKIKSGPTNFQDVNKF